MDTDWQLEQTTLKARYEYLWKTGDKADCRFRAGGKIFPGHKLILFAASPVFERMFYGEIPVKTDEIVEIGDIESDDFKDLLFYVYCNTIEIKTLEKSTNLYYAAKKYMLNGLIKECLDFLTKEAKVQNACEIYEFAKFYEEKDLLNTVMEIIKHNACETISNATNRVDISTVISILDEKKLGSSEVSLFVALKNLAVLQNVIPASEGNMTKHVDNSELELFQKLEELAKIQGIFAEEISAKALEVLNENEEQLQVKHLRDFRNIQKCFGTTKMHLFRTLNEISKIKGHESLPANDADKSEAALEDVKRLLEEDGDNNNEAANILKDIENIDIDTSAVCKRFALYQKFRMAVKKIEFLAFDSNNFFNNAAFSGLLLPEESVAILACLMSRSKVESHYPKDFKKCIRVQ